ncbi:VOC family protein [Acidocella aminolytica]|uniref:Aldoketomutase n=1 Tax=Acidocella aminolytica 101 = DSM 11237 TaxID=1120923 RepID=A0A0D6PK34_9PROT|nr:VOC family protein [Acidocella aminolytica]GAN81114.1 lactoylglutathione lyase/glyoxalase [Acidocella aminolytica 101 = DSM 11237]GBQ32748.1 lactoylglutathione lyase [Acidocella aminolytica 101 = DSM 11237]SHF48374.1 lactoylglutathione lyase [Acidocella aminolytica 101 = DSM 11237]
MAKMIHSMIRVRDEAASLAFYETAFGLRPAARFPFDGFTLIYLRDPEGTFELELTVNNDRTTPYQIGDGYGHLALSVTGIEAEHARATEAGLAPTSLKALMHNNQPLARFFFLTDPDGYKIEVLERCGRYL